MKDQQVAIIVLHYKNAADTVACLTALQKSIYKKYAVFVVNNDASSHLTQLQNDFPEHTYIQNDENLGFAEGNNVGIRKALEDDAVDAVLLLNNDTEVAPDFLEKMIQVDADMVAPRMMQFDNRENVDNLGVVLMSSGLPFNRLNDTQNLFCPSAGCALYSRKLLETVCIDSWYLDPIYFAYAEDLDLGFRARLAGFQSGYASDAIIYHKGSAATSKVSDFAVYHTYRNLMWTQFKNFPFMILLWQLPWLFFGWVSLFGLYILKGKPGIIPRAFLHALIGLRFMFNRRTHIRKHTHISNKQLLALFESGLYAKGLKK